MLVLATIQGQAALILTLAVLRCPLRQARARSAMAFSVSCRRGLPWIPCLSARDITMSKPTMHAEEKDSGFK